MDNKLNLPARYEVRKLEPEHLDWAAAIVCHSNMFHSPVWPVLYPEKMTERCYDMHNKAGYLVQHQISSGYSLGVFDKEYEYKNQEAKEAGGKLLWNDEDHDADAATLLEQMQFPLVSVALAYDGFNALDHDKMAPLIATLPHFETFYSVLGSLDQRDPKSWQPAGPREVLMRNATSTRHDYEGKGIMKALAQYMMRQAAANGFRGIQIECLADAVDHVWANPPEPFKGERVSQFHTLEYEVEDEHGVKSKPFHPCSQRATKVYCTLR